MNEPGTAASSPKPVERSAIANLPKADIEPFHAIAISRLAHRLQTEGRSVIHMEFGQPSTGAPRAAIETAHRILDTDPMGYWESVPLKQRLARHYADSYGVSADPEQFILTCGASPALVLALISRFSPGDRVALARPGYVAYRNTLKALHLVPVEIPCGEAERFQLSSTSLAALDPPPAGVIIASPANPTGTIIPPQELRAIVKVCTARGIQIVSDEIYHGLSFGERTHSILEFDPSAFVINSFSKYFSMVGWRLGWLLVPKEYLHRARAFVGNLFLSAPSLSQHAALAALDAQKELDGHVAVYRRNRELLLNALPRLGLNAIAPPDGAFYVYANVGHLTDDSFKFCKDMLTATGVATAPGIDFDPVQGRSFVRFSFAVSTPQIETAIERMVPWMRSQRVS
jgi:aspartate/methionine/tyrosine aminotransferase